jgi:hypothetical protein
VDAAAAEVDVLPAQRDHLADAQASRGEEIEEQPPLGRERLQELAELLFGEGLAAEREALEKEHRKRVVATKKLHAAQVRRQKEFLRSIGVPDLSPEEVSERACRRPSENLPA